MPSPIGDETDRTIRDEILRTRIRELLPDKADRSRFWSHPLTTLVTGFLLTAVLGTAVGWYFQARSDSAKRKAEVREQRRALALATVDSVGLNLNRTYYAFGTYYETVRRLGVGRALASATLMSREGSFEAAEKEFEAREFVDQARVCVAFGPRLQVEYRSVADSLHWFEVKVRELRERKRTVGDVATSITNIRNAVASIVLRMVEKANQGIIYVPVGSCDARSADRDTVG